jgi:2-oxoglutarate dehydrogenase E1 component
MDAERTLNGYNIAFLESLYEQYERDPGSVDPGWRALIEYERSRPSNGSGNGHALSTAERRIGGHRGFAADADQVAAQAMVDRLVENYRMLGHLRADIDPLGRPRRNVREGLDIEYFRLSEAHLEQTFAAGRLFDGALVPLRDIVAKLQRTYCRKIGVEYWNIQDVEIRSWLREYMEARENQVVPSLDDQKWILRTLMKADEIDRWLHHKYIGAKRFSAAGAESILALLLTLVESAGDHGVEETIIAMAHRGRLSVMLNILDSGLEDLISRFEGGDPWENLGSGDVKYHLGSHRHYVTRTGQPMYMALAFNPSHLEAITPVLAGRVRASQDRHPKEERNRVLPVSLHGDAAVMGQGVYAETLNLSRLDGYNNEGTIRVVINNQVGFTTDPQDSRSTIYATAVADMLNVPVFHVNGDDPEAAAYVAKLAIDFRQKFHRDVIIDLVCYRRFGHNEGDEPTFTQPEMYGIIKKHPSVCDLYKKRLVERGTVTQEYLDKSRDELQDEFNAALESVRQSKPSTGRTPMHGVWENYRGGPDDDVPRAATKIERSVVDHIRGVITKTPEGFNLHKKLQRFVKELDEMMSGEAPLSWAAGEYLAYGSLLMQGNHVRLSGQDCIRGTFTHRHIGWTDQKTGDRYFPLQHLTDDQGRFSAYNSPLSEFAVVGFEFGYTLYAPECLTIWEAQFGDFANGAQVIIDQFISSSEDKWNRLSGLVMLLPHGYEGQGPEHSSARLERYLQLCAEDNMQVCNLTTPAQEFHALRRQVVRAWRKPLVIMSPKSLLRTRQSFSDLREFTEGEFQRCIDDAEVDPKKVRTVMMCTGKVFYDLVNSRTERERDDVAIIRVEQLYPFPKQQIIDALARYSNMKALRWVQEEPDNMGAWSFIEPRLRAIHPQHPVKFCGRPSSASPATGSSESHKLEQKMILDDAFEPPQ